ncbi:zf-HC2 domain-containing protein [Rhodococcus ruber]|uniref:Zf-HC2 domain-containing protein n=1 Tax=Rhodococcus ruber TaxID=1830 RepID=A0ABT4ML68_9NOCA|nr:zf-HC2 domain-containing protein [Rhodococcus ruber]MCZ4521738.1 zf-HC2 domain-containing protein [Rhodococcus ruber]
MREALSARVDGEREPVPSERTDEHLATCTECQAWYASATALTRSLRVRSVGRTPDLTASILTTVGVPVPGSRPQRFLRWVSRDHPWRAALAVIALAQLALGLSQIFGIGHDHVHGGMVMDSEAMTGHLFNESTAWNLAVGVGFLFAAWRPAATNGLLPVLATFTVLLTVFVITDSIAGQVTAERVASHAIIAVGVLVTVMVRHRYNDAGSPTPHRLPADPEADIELPDGARYGRRRGHLRDTNDPAA